MQKTSPEEIAKSAKGAFEASQLLDSSERRKALRLMKEELSQLKEAIKRANEADMLVRIRFPGLTFGVDTKVQAAQAEVEAGRLSSSLVKRLDLFKGDKWESTLQGISDVADLPDPNGNISYTSRLDDGLELYRVSCPIGVLLVIFEARPEVVINIASLAIKSGETFQLAFDFLLLGLG